MPFEMDNGPFFAEAKHRTRFPEDRLDNLIRIILRVPIILAPPVQDLLLPVLPRMGADTPIVQKEAHPHFQISSSDAHGVPDPIEVRESCVAMAPDDLSFAVPPGFLYLDRTGFKVLTVFGVQKVLADPADLGAMDRRGSDLTSVPDAVN